MTHSETYKRALALLELDRGRTFTEVATIVDVTKQTVSTWTTKYKETGLEFLTDKPRPGRPTVLDGLARAKITALACSDAPEGYERWSLRLLADKAVELKLVEAVSYMEVSRILKKPTQTPLETVLVYRQNKQRLSRPSGANSLALCLGLRP